MQGTRLTPRHRLRGVRALATGGWRVCVEKRGRIFAAVVFDPELIANYSKGRKDAADKLAVIAGKGKEI